MRDERSRAQTSSMRKIYLSLLILLSVSSVCNNALAQIVITPAATAAQLAAKLVGPGVTVSSPLLTCPTNAEGTFVGPSTLSFDSGIVLTSGQAMTVGTTIGAGGPASGFASTSNGVGGDPSLTALAGQPTYDRCVLEFDFAPAGDTVKFNYVFGSEEYTSYTCTSFNDVFGFFISGPGFATPTNIALVPGTSIPVCINSVNCGPTGGGSLATCTAVGPGSPFCAYYVNNAAGTTITYNGLTRTLQAIAHVTPCNTYHLKIGIADAFDHILDSGVFLEAGSLTSTGISVTPVGMNSTDTTAGGQYCVRGCLPGQFVFHITAPMASDYVIHYLIGGSAVNGVDYNTIADSIVIPAGSTSSTLLIVPTTTTTGIRQVILSILSPYVCGTTGPSIIDTAIMNIYDNFYVNILTPDTAICLGQSVNIISTGDTSLVYTWSPTMGGSTPLSVVVTPTVTTTYTLSGVYPGAGCIPTTDVITVTVINAFVVEAGTILATCMGVPVSFHATIAPAGGTYSYSWSPTTGMVGATTPNPTITPGVVGDVLYSVTVTETTAGCVAYDTLTLHVLPDDFNLLNPDTAVCFNAMIPVRLNGNSEFTYHWEPAPLVTDPNVATPTLIVNNTTTYTVTGSYPTCPDMVHTVNVQVEAPFVDIRMHDTMFCIGDTIFMDVVAGPPGLPYTLSWTPTTYLVDPTVLAPLFVSNVVGDFPYSITITSPLGCTSTDAVTMSPRPTAQVAITGGNVMVNYGEQIQLDAINLTGYPLFYYWTPNDGTLSNPNINNPVATIYDSVEFVVYAMNQWGCRDSAKTKVYVDDGSSEFVPTAFTPNGDGLNDIFRIRNIRFQKLVMFEVYNRWGERVYQNNSSNDADQGWDGTFNGQPQDMGIYNYQIIVAKPNKQQKMYKGNVTLIR